MAPKRKPKDEPTTKGEDERKASADADSVVDLTDDQDEEPNRPAKRPHRDEEGGAQETSHRPRPPGHGPPGSRHGRGGGGGGCSGRELDMRESRVSQELSRDVEALNGSKALIRLFHLNGQLDSKAPVLTLQVRTLTGKTVPIKCEGTHTIGMIKAIFWQVDGPPIDQTRLIHSGRQLENHETVAGCGMHDGSIVHAILKLRGS